MRAQKLEKMKANLVTEIAELTNNERVYIKNYLQSNGEYNTSTHAVGGGMWTIEVDFDNQRTFELCGSNGTRDDEASDLWGELKELDELAERFKDRKHAALDLLKCIYKIY